MVIVSSLLFTCDAVRAMEKSARGMETESDFVGDSSFVVVCLLLLFDFPLSFFVFVPMLFLPLLLPPIRPLIRPVLFLVRTLPPLIILPRCSFFN